MAYGRGEGLGLASGLLSGVFLAVGLGVAGLFVADGLVEARVADRSVTVTGVAEREVKADLAVWALRVTAAAPALPDAQAEIDDQIDQVSAFLLASGFDEAEFSLGELRPEAYASSGGGGAGYRLEQPVVVRSRNVDLVAEVSQRLGELARQGAAAASEHGPAFVFTRLGDIKADLLDEAALDARATAERFADQAAARLGGVIDAEHGEVAILPRDDVPWEDEATAIFKRVRVTSTVTYQLNV